MAIKILENEILVNHSTFKIGGPARYFVVAKSKEEILEAIGFAKEKNLPHFVFGGGSNILFKDEGYDGVAIKNQNSKIKIKNDPKVEQVHYGAGNSKFKIIEVGAGNLLSQLISFSMENNLSGLEWGVGIPGTVGGCVAGNCGAYGKDISGAVASVSVIDENGDIKKYNKEECDFFYRESKFKKAGNKEIILEVELNLEKGDIETSKEYIKNILTDRKGKNPPHPSIGCIFKNFKDKKIATRSLIEQCGLKGERVGGAQISEIQPNFIVNINNATAKDVLSLIGLCKQKVKEKFNLDLEEEIVII